VSGLSASAVALLAVFGLAAGIGITAVGPGGVLATVGLFTLTSLSPAHVAGTALVTHVATGLLGSAAYARSGELRDHGTRRIAAVIAAAACVGAPLGVLINTLIAPSLFGALLGGLALLTCLLLWHRDRRDPPVPIATGARARIATAPLAVAGVAVGVAGGLFGIGGPMLMVPLLVALGAPILTALAAAQVQSVVIAGVGSLGYLAHHAIDWPLAGLVGVPELCGVLGGWAIARALPGRTLTRVLMAALLGLVPYLVLHG
jgi:hypothetical protein